MRGALPPRRRETFDGPNEHDLGPDDSFPGTPEAFPVLTRLFNRDGTIFEFENDESERGMRLVRGPSVARLLPIASFRKGTWGRFEGGVWGRGRDPRRSGHRPRRSQAFPGHRPWRNGSSSASACPTFSAASWSDSFCSGSSIRS